MSLSAIVSFSQHDRAINSGDMDVPWRFKKDLERFRTLTLGHAVIMGRKTADTFRKPLDWRINIVITRNTEYKKKGFYVCDTAEQFQYSEDAFVIGGQQIYEMYLPKCRYLYTTVVNERVRGATAWFPEIDMQEWEVMYHKWYEGFGFVDYRRRLWPEERLINNEASIKIGKMIADSYRDEALKKGEEIHSKWDNFLKGCHRMLK